MRIPARLRPLIEYGVITEVVRPLLSGKEAQVYLVESGGELRAAKVYKSTQERSFRHRSSYTEGRKVRNSRDRRAMGKNSRYGREQQEAAWNTAEADMIRKLHRAGVRVPKPYDFVEGVLVMECIQGPDGGVAPRISDCPFTREEGIEVCDQIIRQIVKMLCAGVVHADMSVFNVLMADDGPVVIDFPQSVSAASNPHARKILLRDVANITDALRFGRAPQALRYGYEMWDLYENGELDENSVLTGKYDVRQHQVDPDILMLEMQQVEEDEALAEMDDEDFDY
ncbi:RIO1 family regulatory kinase/ATPase [Bradymonas sediminis]|uniref:non-specific serine/threonine protein kinase n=1 Tax=Bradymonas sediminis TaxID=1548548 RepID=A0A2Z4FMG4_9DELT|nr:RIO1 family regulatory kinase/ATPase [Bradymonas sediminis]AWV90015.1 serine protein kinase RIO [Bradymonas sediminis]TDP76029.1 RIO kinase 1 [Bradymonas sediminis]